jgi:hypothetical protein
LLDKDWLRDRIKTVLQNYDVYSLEAQELLMLTAAQESKLGTYLTQISGPALSIFQIEPKTYQDIFDRVLSKRWKGCFSPDPMSLIVDFDKSIMACRAKYLSIPEPIPSDAMGMARYWKKYYNTKLGKGTAREAYQNYRKYC